MDYFQGGFFGCFIAIFVFVVATALLWVSDTFSPQVAIFVALGILFLGAFIPSKADYDG